MIPNNLKEESLFSNKSKLQKIIHFSWIKLSKKFWMIQPTTINSKQIQQMLIQIIIS